MPPAPAEQIAAELHETGYRQLGTIKDCCRALGPECVRGLAEEAKRVDARRGAR